MKQGYLISAQNNGIDDYIACARVLAKSIKLTGDARPVSLLTDSTDYPGLEIFDQVILLPFDDAREQTWKLSNDWQVYQNSPYEQTLKIEADVIVTRNLDSWWDILQSRELFIATGCRDYKQKISHSRFYRKTLDNNRLPDVYNGITYFRKTKLSKQFYQIVKKIFDNWSEISLGLDYKPQSVQADTDTVYAIAADIVGRELCTVDDNSIQWVHMKQQINNSLTQDWTQEFIWELSPYDFRINTVSQLYPVHYHVKSLAKHLEPHYDRYLKNI